MENKRKHLRLRLYDYSSAGAYFVTICVRNRKCLLGQIKNREVVLSNIGQIVRATWDLLPTKFPNIRLDQFVVMPNHVHGIVFIHSDFAGTANVGAIHELPLQMERNHRRNMLIPKIVGYFKMNTAKRINEILQSPGNSFWQRNYYERVIRNEHELLETRQYIHDNPLKWDTDPENICRLEPQEA